MPAASGATSIMLALLAFVALTIGVMVYGFDTSQFRRITEQHEATQESIRALHDAVEARAIREGTAAANGETLYAQASQEEALQEEAPQEALEEDIEAGESQ